jgi:hypothetical protein
MDSPDDVFPAEDRCEVCGGELGDEIRIQEFADGSLARLCPECAAGAALDDEERPGGRPPVVAWPTEPAEASAGGSAEFDPLEKTRELLMPVTDLIALQAEMQSALERLASSLERFATEILTESQGKTAVESRLQMLERELDKTRARLAETEFLLVNTFETAPGALAGVVYSAPTPAVADTSEGGAEGTPAAVPGETPGAAVEPEPVAPPTVDLWSWPEARELESAPEAEETVPETEDAQPAVGEPSSPFLDTEIGPGIGAAQVAEAADVAEAWPGVEAAGVGEAGGETLSPEAAAPLVAPLASEAPPAVEATAATTIPLPWDQPPAPEPAAEPASPAEEEPRGTGFRIEEVQAAQRHYNESSFTNRIRDVRNSLGKPKANLTRVPGDEPRAIVTIAWDIVWYQYLVDLHRDLPSTHERVVLHREGMDLDELAYYFKEPNAVVNDDGRLDASELEVRLLSDPSALITEMTPADMQALEDATEEIWDQRIAPEFKWDD